MKQTLYTYEYANVDYDAAVELLASDASSLLQDATNTSIVHSGEVAARLHTPVAGFEIGRDVTIVVEDFEPVEMLRARVPLSWHSSEHAGLFPALTGHLEVSALSLVPPMTQVTLVGTYEPPLGLVGAAAESFGGRHLVEATVKRFVQDIVARLEKQLA